MSLLLVVIAYFVICNCENVIVEYTAEPAILDPAISGIYTESFICTREEGGGWFGNVDHTHCFRKEPWLIWNTGCGWEIGEIVPDQFDAQMTEFQRKARYYTGQCAEIPAIGLTTDALTTTTFYDGFGANIADLESFFETACDKSLVGYGPSATVNVHTNHGYLENQYMYAGSFVPIQMGDGNSYDNYIFIHPMNGVETYAEWELQSKYSRFTAVVGPAQNAHCKDNLDMEFIIYIDGIEKFRSQTFTVDKKYENVDIIIDGGNVLKIETDEVVGEGCDHAIVANPNLCESEPEPEPEPECARDATTFDWDALTTDGIEQSPQIDVIKFSINVDETAQTDLTLNIEVRVPYVVRASADDQLTANFGTTYVLDFEDFDAHKSSITQPNTCSNRLESDYIGKTTTSSRFEILSDSLDAIGTNDNMCYPATDGSGWEIIKDDDCNSILYKGKWTWGELRECRNNDGALTDAGVQQTSVDNTDPNYLQLFGTFYVNMISPFWYEDYAKNKDQNMDFYRVYQLISQPFVIQISKSVYVIGSTGINVMTMSIIAVYKEDQDEDYILILLTEAAEYMELINGQIITVPQSTQFKLAMQSTSESSGCLNNKAYLCSQLWKIYTTEQTCDTDRDELTNPTGGIDFSGDYQLRFTPQCRQNVDETHCLGWLEKHPIYKNDNTHDNNVQNGVILSSHLTFVDGICEAKTFTIQLEATMNFYENADYTGYIDPESSPHLYQVGKDTVYGEIKLVFPTATEDIFDSELINVWLCTFPPDTNPLPPDQNGPDINKAVHDATNGGCFSNLRDGFINGEGDEFFFHVYGENIAEEDFIVNQNGNEGNDVIQFEFTVPHEIQRDTLYVHAQVEVLLEELPRRRLLLDIKTKPRGASTNKIAHFGRNIGITNQPNNNKPKQPPQEPISPISPIQQPPASQPFTISLNSTWVIIIGALLSIILLFNIILMCYMNCCKSNNGRAKISFSKNRRNGYDSVKHIDSEQFDDSEANLINVN